jgi:ribosome-associated protein
MKDFLLSSELDFIPLCDLLKAVGLCDSGGEAKHFISDGQVKVDGLVDTRKRRKVRRGEVVEFRQEKIKIF